ncbi:hypothetical protein JCM12825_04400 [Desulfurobacterium crinifex]
MKGVSGSHFVEYPKRTMKNVGNTTAEKSATLLSKNLEEKKKIRIVVRTTDRREGILSENSDTEPETVEKSAKTQL